MATYFRSGSVLGLAAVMALCWLGLYRLHAAEALDIYFIDVGGGVGNATLLVAPSGESMLLDAGPPYTTKRVLDVLKKAGVKQLDYLVTTHYHADHCGATAELADH